MKKLWLIPLLLSFLGTAMAEQRLQGWCEIGGQKVVTQGTNSTTTVQVSYPSCTVTVYQTGTVTKATLHSDNSGTVLANPFTANSNGSWGFYTADGRYDIVLSKTASTGFPFTISDVLFCDPTTCGGGGGGGSGTVTSVGVSASNTGLSVAGSPVTTSGTIALTSSASAGDQALRSTAANVSSYTAIPQCTDSAGNHLNYDTATHTFSCGNSGSGGTGTVTSVSMTATDTGFSVSGVPITTSGTIALTSGATAADQTLISTATAVTNFTPVPNCQDSAGQHLNYNTTTHLFSCGSSTPSAGIALSPCGVWAGSTAYAQGCVVFYSGSSYAAQVANTGIAPGSEGGVTWQVFAQAGSNGTNGTNGTNGATGAPGAPGYSPNQIISGCGVSYGGTGFTFTVQQCTFLVNNIQYTALQTSVTGTAADPSLDRVDSIVANSCASLPCNGTITIVPGTASATPAPPSLDLNTQTQITFYQVGAGSTQPSNLATTDIYHNNTEWTCASTANFNCASTNNPHTGTLDIEATSATAGNNARLTIPAGTVNVGDYNTVNFYIRSKAAWAATRSLTIQLYNGTTAKCTPVTFRDGNFTFNSATLGSYQLMSVPTSVFGCDGIPVTQLRFTVAGTGTVIGFYLDDITLEGGLISPVGTLGEVWKGNWSSTTAYSVNNEVFYATTGSSYVALQANTGVTPGSNSTIWQVKDTHGPAGVDGNVQTKSGASFSAINTSVSGSDVTWPGKLLATSFESTDTVSNTNWQFLTGSGGDSTCDSFLPSATNATLCIKNGIVTEAKNGGVTFYPLATTTGSTTTDNCAKFDANGNVVDSGASCGTGSGSVTNIATTTPIAGGPITTTGTITCPTCAIGPGTSTANHLAKFSGTDGVTLADGGAITSGTVTSVATTSPITGGTITGTGTIACATCVTSAAALTANQIVIGAGSQASAALGSLGTTTTVLHGNAGGAPSFGAIAPADTNSTLNVYGIGGVFGSDNGSALATADINPQASIGQFIVAGTLTTIIIKGDAGVSTIKFGYRHTAATTSYTSAVLTLAVVGGITDTVACANVAGTAITIDGVSVTCSTLATQTMTLGDSIITNGGAADGTTKRIAWTFVYTR
jgi:collagen type VII alpha